MRFGADRTEKELDAIEAKLSSTPVDEWKQAFRPFITAQINPANAWRAHGTEFGVELAATFANGRGAVLRSPRVLAVPDGARLIAVMKVERMDSGPDEERLAWMRWEVAFERSLARFEDWLRAAISGECRAVGIDAGILDAVMAKRLRHLYR